MNYKVNQFIYAKPLHKKAKIRSINTEANTAQISYWNKDNKLELAEVYLTNIEPLRPRKKPLEIKVKYFDNTLPKIEKINIGDWIDLRAAGDIELKQFEYKLIPLGIAVQLPKGFEANIVPRSSTFKNYGILQTNHFGVVDESYCGDNDQWYFPALAMKDTVIKKGDRICQFRINRKMPKVQLVEVKELNNQDRGGIGSTGTN